MSWLTNCRCVPSWWGVRERLTHSSLQWMGVVILSESRCGDGGEGRRVSRRVWVAVSDRLRVLRRLMPNRSMR